MAMGNLLQFDLDNEDIKLFCEEAEEQLELLDTSLVQLEGEPDPELVQKVFRAVHTLKGSAATIGHKKMAGLTHAMETVLDALRQGEKQATTEMVDELLAALDALRILAHEVVTRIDAGVDTSPLQANLQAVLEAGDRVVSATAVAENTGASYLMTPEAIAAVHAELKDGETVFFAEFAIDPDCQLPSIRCYQVLQELDELGAVHASWPKRASVEAGATEFSLVCIFASSHAEEQLKSALENVSDVSTSLRILSIEELSAPITVSGAPPVPEATRRPNLTLVDQIKRSPAPADIARPKKPAAQSVRIDVQRLDGLMNLVGELVIDRTRLQQVRQQLTGLLKSANLTELSDNFEETTTHLARVTDELQEEIMRSRMLPVRSVLTRLPRLVRDVAAKCGKKVELTTAGEETELDRSVIEEISDPLVHILRNAIDHGIETPEERRAAGKPETGAVSVTAWNQETYIYLSVKDDGEGIDTATLRRKVVEKGLLSREIAENATEEQVLQYIFFPGLSTAKTLSDVSGRGVGMDIVRTNIERLNGQITLKSTRGEGSEVVIQLPLTLATTKALMVIANDTVYAIPLVSVTEVLAEHNADIHSVTSQRTLRLRGRLLPMVDLANALGDARPRRLVATRFVVAAKHGERRVAFVVDRLLGEQDVVVKSLGELVGNHKGLTGATILGDGTLGLIVDTPSLIDEQAQIAVSA